MLIRAAIQPRRWVLLQRSLVVRTHACQVARYKSLHRWLLAVTVAAHSASRRCDPMDPLRWTVLLWSLNHRVKRGHCFRVLSPEVGSSLRTVEIRTTGPNRSGLTLTILRIRSALAAASLTTARPLGHALPTLCAPGVCRPPLRFFACRAKTVFSKFFILCDFSYIQILHPKKIFWAQLLYRVCPSCASENFFFRFHISTLKKYSSETAWGTILLLFTYNHIILGHNRKKFESFTFIASTPTAPAKIAMFYSSKLWSAVISKSFELAAWNFQGIICMHGPFEKTKKNF